MFDTIYIKYRNVARETKFNLREQGETTGIIIANL